MIGLGIGVMYCWFDVVYVVEMFECFMCCCDFYVQLFVVFDVLQIVVVVMFEEWIGWFVLMWFGSDEFEDFCLCVVWFVFDDVYVQLIVWCCLWDQNWQIIGMCYVVVVLNEFFDVDVEFIEGCDL